MCPACGAFENYLLGDGRKKCRNCGKKYSVGKRKSRVEQSKLKEIAKHFIAMVPANQSAETVALNKKTIQRLYRQIRFHIVRQNKLDELSYIQSSKGLFDLSYFELNDDVIPLFVVVQWNSKVVLLSIKEALQEKIIQPPAAVIYANISSLNSLDIERFKQKNTQNNYNLRTGSSNGADPSQFWAFARSYLKAYHGGIKVNLRLFIHEMVFRYNLNYGEQKSRELLDGVMKCF